MEVESDVDLMRFDTYVNARLVITKNLHCALPCLAMNVPVVLVISKYDHDRFQGLSPFLNIIGESETGEFTVKIARDASGAICNPGNHKPLSSMLKQLCHAFMKNDSVTVHHGPDDGLSVLDEESELYARYPLVRKVRNFFYKKTLDRNGAGVRILKTFHFYQKT